VSYWRLFYHLIWATKDRALLIDAQHHQTIQGLIRAKGQEARALIHAVGIMPDHIHVVASIPPGIAIATLVGKMKGATSRELNELMQAETGAAFAWQGEYGVLSFSEKALAAVVAYASNQPAHHAAHRLWRGLEQTEGTPHCAPTIRLP
jgi:putative transposase